MFWEEKILEVNVGRDDKKGPVFSECMSGVHVNQCHHFVALQETTSLQLQVTNFILVPLHFHKPVNPAKMMFFFVSSLFLINKVENYELKYKLQSI